MLIQDIGNGTLPDPSTDPELLYMVIPQPGTTNASDGGDHAYININGTNAHYGWTVDPGDLDSITYYSTHEITESVTDPVGTAIQVNPSNPSAWNEICDGEAQNYSYRLNGYLVPSFFSEADHGYVVPTGQSQNFYVSSSRVLTVNGDQLADPDDTVTVAQTNGGYTVTLNGETVQFDSGDFFTLNGRIVAPVSSIVVNPGTGNDTLNINATLAGSPITINPGSGDDTVNINGASSPIAINLGAGNDTVNTNGAGSPITINPGSGSDTVNVNAMLAGGPITINPETGDDTVNIEATVGLISSVPAATVNLGAGQIRSVSAPWIRT